jgi:hypothetical protein
LLDATYQLSYYCWNNYYTSFLQVVNDLSMVRTAEVNHQSLSKDVQRDRNVESPLEATSPANDATYQLSYYCWNNYYTSFLQVVNDLSISEAGYVRLKSNIGVGAKRNSQTRKTPSITNPSTIMAMM